MHTGAQTDQNSLVYLNARYLDPATGTFLTRDPFEGVADNSMSRNPYSYTGGNPVNRTDRSGQCFWDGCLLEAALLGAAIGGVVGASVNGAIQIGSGMAFKHQSFGEAWNDVRWGDVALSGVEGAFLGAFSGPVGAFGSSLVKQGTISAGQAALGAFAFNTAIGTASAVYVHRQNFGTALASNVIGGLVAHAAGYGVQRIVARATGLGKFIDMMSPEDAVRYNQYWDNVATNRPFIEQMPQEDAVRYGDYWDQLARDARTKYWAEKLADELHSMLPAKLRPAVVAAGESANGKFYFGISGPPVPVADISPELAASMPSASLENHPIAACSEFKICNLATWAGDKISNLTMYAVKVNSGEAIPRCLNCQITSAGARVPSDWWNDYR
ncbi:MAG: RHS repeat-associated core domain-containing protein [Chloroflexota bacterium]